MVSLRKFRDIQFKGKKQCLDGKFCKRFWAQANKFKHFYWLFLNLPFADKNLFNNCQSTRNLFCSILWLCYHLKFTLNNKTLKKLCTCCCLLEAQAHLCTFSPFKHDCTRLKSKIIIPHQAKEVFFSKFNVPSPQLKSDIRMERAYVSCGRGKDHAIPLSWRVHVCACGGRLHSG